MSYIHISLSSIRVHNIYKKNEKNKELEVRKWHIE